MGVSPSQPPLVSLSDSRQEAQLAKAPGGRREEEGRK